jgi:hypothetical protein
MLGWLDYCKYGILIFLLSFLGAGSLLSQSFVYTGIVTDAVTDEPIPFANVYFVGSTSGGMTDFDGKYTITVYKRPDTIAVSVLGYKPAKKPISPNSQITNFKLERDAYNLEEIVIVAGENPADIILKRVIENKKLNDKDKLDRYAFQAYNKTEIDLYDIDDKFMDRKVMKPFLFVFDYLDSTSEEAPYLPAFLAENLSDFYYRKDPKQRREEIKASRISGIDNESLSQMMGSLYQEVDIYDNWISLISKDFASPIADNALNYYKYYLVDSGFIDGYYSYKLNFVPRSKGYNTFLGDIWIADSSYAVMKINMQVADHVNINFIERSSVYQEFGEIQPGTWMITRDKIVIKFKVVDKAVGIIGRKTASFKDFKINDKALDSVFVNRDDIAIAENVIVEDERFWETVRHEELSSAELGVYQMVDSLKNNKAFKTWIDIIDLVLNGYYQVKYVEFGPYSSLVSLNKVEQFRFRVGFRTTAEISKQFRVGAYIAYGTGDKMFKYGANGMVYIQKKPQLYLGGSYMFDYDLAASSDAEFGKDNILSGLYRRRKVPLKLNLMREWTAYAYKEWRFGLSHKILFRNSQVMPKFAYSYIPQASDIYEDTLITNFTNTEVDIINRFAYKETFLTDDFDRLSLGTKHPILYFRYRMGLKNILNSGFKYQRIDFILTDEYAIKPLGTLHMDVTMGKIFGTLPTQLLEIFQGNETYFYNDFAFNLMNEYEFVSDMYITISLRHHLEGFFFNKIPGFRKLKWREVIGFKAAWGTISDENKKANVNNFSITPFPIPYMETSIGIENILKIFRVDAVFRITYRNRPEFLYTTNMGVRLGIAIDF